jgi:hypothetical protein
MTLLMILKDSKNQKFGMKIEEFHIEEVFSLIQSLFNN